MSSKQNFGLPEIHLVDVSTGKKITDLKYLEEHPDMEFRVVVND